MSLNNLEYPRLHDIKQRKRPRIHYPKTGRNVDGCRSVFARRMAIASGETLADFLEWTRTAFVFSVSYQV